MSHVLLAQTEDRGLGAFLGTFWPVLVPALVGFIAIYWLLPKARRALPLVGGVCGVLALILVCTLVLHAEGPWPETVLFYAFAIVSILAAGSMVTQHNPVYAALSFALVVLGTCGLFLLQAAPFLMAATIIIYAGAIVVTFLFVIMLAQQEGLDSADFRSREPFLGTLAGFVMIAALLCVLQRSLAHTDVGDPGMGELVGKLEAVRGASSKEEANEVLGTPGSGENARLRVFDPVFPRDDTIGAGLEESWQRGNLEQMKTEAASALAELRRRQEAAVSLVTGPIPGKETSEPGILPHRNVEALGQTLFTDYLVPVELAGVLLLAATIGAIVIAGRHSEVLR